MRPEARNEPQYFYGERQKAIFEEALAKLPRVGAPQARHEVLAELAEKLQELREFERCSLERTGPTQLKHNYRQAAILQASKVSISSFCVLGDGRILSGDHSGTLRVWHERQDCSWVHHAVKGSTGVVDRIFAVPGGGFVSITKKYDGYGTISAIKCFVWHEEDPGEWQGTELPLGDAKSAEIRALPDGKIVLLVGQRVEVWRRELGGAWVSTELGQGLDCYAVLPDGRIVAANRVTSSIEVFGEQNDGSWAGKKIAQREISGAESISVMRSGSIVLMQGDFWSDGAEIAVLAEDASGEWRCRVVHSPEQGQLCGFEVLPSGLIATRPSSDYETRLWSKREDGRWVPWSSGEIEIDIASLCELPSGGLVELPWGSAIVIWQPGDSGEWKRTQVWKTVRDEGIQAFGVLPSGDMLLVKDRHFMADAELEEETRRSLVVWRRRDSDSWDKEEIPLREFCEISTRDPSCLELHEKRIAALPDGKLAVRLGNNQIFIFDGDSEPGASS